MVEIPRTTPYPIIPMPYNKTSSQTGQSASMDRATSSASAVGVTNQSEDIETQISTGPSQYTIDKNAKIDADLARSEDYRDADQETREKMRRWAEFRYDA